jgi:hypothetical protein
VAKSDFGSFNPAAYAPVAERIRLFWESFPNGRIETRLVSRTHDDVVFEARVYRTADEAMPAATGWAAEREGDGDVNLVACLENTETSAVGRALANLGFTAAKERPSAEEMAKAARARTRLQRRSDATDRSHTAAAPLTPRLYGDLLLQQRANALADFLRLLGTAERAGLRPARASALRASLGSGHPAPEVLVKHTSILRNWLVKRRAERILPSSPSH